MWECLSYEVWTPLLFLDLKNMGTNSPKPLNVAQKAVILHTLGVQVTVKVPLQIDTERSTASSNEGVP